MKEIALTKGMVALVDDDDYAELSQWKWHAGVGGRYAARRLRVVGRPMVLMHRVIVAPEPGLHVDHINRNTLDNRRENLRAVLPVDNWRNRSRPKGARGLYRGVEQINGGRWRARLRLPGATTGHLGVFDTPEEAARAFDRAAAQAYGEFAVLNFPA